MREAIGRLMALFIVSSHCLKNLDGDLPAEMRIAGLDSPGALTAS